MVGEGLALEREELARRLLVVTQRDRGLAIWLTSRCALRAFPLLATGGQFVYWTEDGDGNFIDHRVKHLAAVWRAIVIPLCAKELGPVSKVVADDAYDAYVEANATTHVAATNAAHVAANAAFLYGNPATTSATTTDATGAAAAAVIRTINAATVYGKTSAINVSSLELKKIYVLQTKRDLDEIEKVMSVNALRSRPLWLLNAKEYNAVISYTHEKIRQEIDSLISEHSKKINAKLTRFLREIYPSYQAIVSGRYKSRYLIDTFKLDNDQFYEHIGELEGYQSVKREVRPRGISEGEPEHSGELGNTKISNAPWARYDYLPSDRFAQDEVGGDDALDRQELADALSRLLLAKDNNSHFAVGLLGEWGSGKSFLLKLIHDNVRSEHEDVEFLVGHFNAWAYEQSDSLQAGVAQQAIVALTENLQPKELMKLVFKFAWRRDRLKMGLSGLYLLGLLIILPILFAKGLSFANWTGGLLALVGLGFTKEFYQSGKELLMNPLAKNFHTYLNLPSYGEHLGQIPIMQQQIKTMCELRLGNLESTGIKKQRRLLYIVDDLDRCGPNGILKTLEAIRLMMDIPQVTVIIAVDHRIALAALAHHYKELAPYQPERPARAIARDYLGKIIQLPITLTAPDHETVDSFISKQLLSEDQSKISLSELMRAVDDESYDWELLTNDAPVVVTLPSSGDNVQKYNNKPVVDAASESQKLREPEASDDAVTGSIAGMPKTESNQENTDKPKEQFMLPPQLSAAFRYWINQFHLHNPRQIKRLYNSYNLIWHYYGEAEQRSTQHAYSYSRLLGLILLDYLNTLPSEKRKAVNLFLEQKGVQASSLNGLEPAHWERVRTILSAYPRWRQEVEPFVLPALDAVEQSGSNSEPSPSEGQDTTTPND